MTNQERVKGLATSSSLKRSNNSHGPIAKRPLKNRSKKVLMTTGSLVKVESIAECSLWSIPQYFWPALSDNRYWKPFFGLFKSDRFTKVLLFNANKFHFLHTLKDWSNYNWRFLKIFCFTLDRWQSRTLLTINECTLKIARNRWATNGNQKFCF